MQTSLLALPFGFSGLCRAFSLFCCISVVQAGHYTSTNSQNSGQSWTNAIWRLNGAGTVKSPAAGNTYELISNGVVYGNDKSNTRVRNPLQRGLLEFPGDSLVLNANTEIELKRQGEGGAPTVLFSGVGSGPGLILDGGSVTVDDNEIFKLTGRVAVVSQSYIATGEDGGGILRPDRALTLAADLSGAGNLVWFQGGTKRAQQVTGNNRTYTGTWVLKAGWLLPGHAHAMAANNVLIDPLFPLPFPSVVNVPGPAIFEPGVDVATSGWLRLTNGGSFRLHQNCAFGSAAFDGIPLGPGRHSFADLLAAFPDVVLPGGSGSLTVESMGGIPAVAPRWQSQPASGDFETGGTAVLTATAKGTLPMSYQWEKKQNSSFVAMTDGAGVSGAKTRTLLLNGLQLTDASEYRLVASNAGGNSSSQAAQIRVIRPTFPQIAVVFPAPGARLSALTTISVRFDKLVSGVEAEDLIVNGSPAVWIAGSGSNYTFGISQPPPGDILVAWDVDSAILDDSGRFFDASAGWTYTLEDTDPPRVAALSPAPGALVTGFSQCQVVFSEPVQGVGAADLLAGGNAALEVSGSGAGPYVFRFAPVDQVSLQFSWAADHGIMDLHSNIFGGSGWALMVDSQDQSRTNILITEILCASASTNALADEDGDRGDWIELRNVGVTSVNLTGWALSDNSETSAKWTFPTTNLGPGKFLVIFASGKDRRVAGARLHTNFKLSSSGGYLGLFQADRPPIAVHGMEYPEQRNDISYGIDPAFSVRFFAQPTPGALNGYSTIQGVVENIRMSAEAGFFSQPFQLVLTTTTPGSAIFWTTNGSVPGVAAGVTNGRLYTGSVTIGRTTALRAAAYAPNLLPSKVASRTFLFVEDVIRQPNNPVGYPVGDVWTPTPGANQNGARAYYQMSPVVVDDPLYSDRVRQGLMSVPALSIQLPIPDLFDPERGIYTHPQSRGPAWERACSMELIYPGSKDGLQIDGSIQIQGGTQREPGKNAKHSFRVNFKGEYGPSKLEFPIFPDSPVASFDRLVLDGGINMWWHYVGGSSPADQRYRAQGVRDQFTSDLMNAIGHPSFHGKFFNVFLNGLYWGLHYTHEMPDESFAAEYFGGEPEDYDVIRNTTTMTPQVLSGDLEAWNKVLSLSNTGLTNHAQYAELQQYVDLDNFIDYMLVNHWSANEDWPHHNWYVIRKRAPGAGFKFMIWDAEHTLKGVNYTAKFELATQGTPAQILMALSSNPEFRLRFADHAQKHFFNGGIFYTHPAPAQAIWDPMHPERNIPASFYMRRIQEIDTAIVAESARWGGYTLGVNYTRDEHWLRELNNLLGYTNTAGNTASFFPLRSAVVLNKYRSMGLWPVVQAPAFSRHGGMVAPGFALTMENPNSGGTIYYTTNGLDPRVPNSGAVAPWAAAWTNGQPLVLNRSVILKARVLGSAWSPVVEAQFTVGTAGLPIRITEIMYDPPGGSAYEFFEIQNLGPAAVDLAGWHCEGVRFLFPSGVVLAPRGILVIASTANPAAFAARYPGVVVAGYFTGSLANEGERLALRDAADRLVVSVDYDNSGGWPAAASGGGRSLEIIDPAGDPDAPANWAASSRINGTPGFTSEAQSSPVVMLSEVMAENNGWVQNAGAYPDWFEMANTSSAEVSIAGWSVSDGSNPRKYVFPAGAVIPANGYLVVWCDTNTAAPGLHAGFALEASGESLFLYDNTSNRVDALTFGQQLGNYSLARVGTGASWGLATPTAGSANLSATLAPVSSLAVNEWLADSPPGAQDWLELHNRSDSMPAALQGLVFSCSNGVFQCQSLSFIAPKGFARFWADEAPGPLHLDFKLKADGDFIRLQDITGQVVDEVRFGQQQEAVSQGRLPDGASAIVSFPGTPSPGAPNYQASQTGPVLNEIMARNTTTRAPDGSTPDWLELYNPTSKPIPVQGMLVAGGLNSSRRWAFPSGIIMASQSYLVVWLDESRPPSTQPGSELNAGFSLSGSGDSIHFLSAQGLALDSVSFGAQIQNLPIGRDGTGWALLADSTPGTPNSVPAALATASGIRINEWMAQDSGRDDWFELYNQTSEPVSLAGLALSDDPSAFGTTNYVVTPLSYIAPRGYVVFIADGKPGKGPDHVSFSLDKHAGMLRLYDAEGGILDTVSYGLQSPGVSEGLLPDGGVAIAQFPGNSTPGSANFLPLSRVRINEILSHTDPPFEDAIELYNSYAIPFPIGGWFVSDSESEPAKFRIPDGTMIPPLGYRVFYESDFAASGLGLNSARGGTIFLNQAISNQLTGCRDSVEFGPALNGVSWGMVQTSAGLDFAPMSRPTFGIDAPSSIQDFRSGNGASNALPLVGPLVISEIMYDPAPSSTNVSAAATEEFIEIANLGSVPEPLYDPAAATNVWTLRDGVEFAFPGGSTIAARGTALVVGFNPEAEPQKLAHFRARYGLDSSVVMFGPFTGRLSNEGERVSLYMPDRPQGPSHPDAGFVPYALADKVVYSADPPWPPASGVSLQRIRLAGYGNEPLNWQACAPTPGSANCGVISDADADGLPDDWEIAHGLNPNSDEGDDGADGDPDRDGFTNMAEFIAGTHPREQFSRLIIAHALRTSEGLRIEFEAVANRAYTIQYRDSLSEGSWLKLEDIPAAASSGLVVKFYPTANATARYYRLVIPAQESERTAWK